MQITFLRKDQKWINKETKKKIILLIYKKLGVEFTTSFDQKMEGVELTII